MQKHKKRQNKSQETQPIILFEKKKKKESPRKIHLMAYALISFFIGFEHTYMNIETKILQEQVWYTASAYVGL